MDLQLIGNRNNIQAKLTGGVPLSENSETQYKSHFNGLTYFFGLIGDYSSLLILLNYTLNFFPSMNPVSIILYYKWRTEKPFFECKGILLNNYLKNENGEILKDRNDLPIICAGTWYFIHFIFLGKRL